MKKFKPEMEKKVMLKRLNLSNKMIATATLEKWAESNIGGIDSLSYIFQVKEVLWDMYTLSPIKLMGNQIVLVSWSTGGEFTV